MIVISCLSRRIKRPAEEKCPLKRTGTGFSLCFLEN